jgi:hypothetical protein
MCKFRNQQGCAHSHHRARGHRNNTPVKCHRICCMMCACVTLQMHGRENRISQHPTPTGLAHQPTMTSQVRTLTALALRFTVLPVFEWLLACSTVPHQRTRAAPASVDWPNFDLIRLQRSALRGVDSIADLTSILLGSQHLLGCLLAVRNTRQCGRSDGFCD